MTRLHRANSRPYAKARISDDSVQRFLPKILLQVIEKSHGSEIRTRVDTGSGVPHVSRSAMSRVSVEGSARPSLLPGQRTPHQEAERRRGLEVAVIRVVDDDGTDVTTVKEIIDAHKYIPA